MADALSRFSQLDILLPSQYLGLPNARTPEQRLMIAVLHDVLDCVEKYRCATDVEGSRQFQEAKDWLLANNAEWLYSFECICEVLNLDSQAVLQRVLFAADPHVNPLEAQTG